MSIWDTPLTGDTSGGFRILPPGEYEFTVKSAIGAEHKPKPGGKIGHCAEIKLTLIVEGKDTKGRESSVLVFDNLYSDPKTQWKMNAFAKTTEMWHDGMTPWELTQSAGAIGRCRLIIGQDNKGRDRNEVDRYIVPETPVVNPPENIDDPEITDGELPF